MNKFGDQHDKSEKTKENRPSNEDKNNIEWDCFEFKICRKLNQISMLTRHKLLNILQAYNMDEDVVSLYT